MIRQSVAGAVVFVVTLALSAQGKGVEQVALPAAVQKTVQQESKGATIKGYSREREHGKKVYEAEMVVNGHSRDIQVAEDGTLNEIEEEVPLGSLPPVVQTALLTKAGDAKITKVEALTKRKKLVSYEAATLKGGKKGEIRINADASRASAKD